jgi:hypothetical protein
MCAVQLRANLELQRGTLIESLLAIELSEFEM